MSVILFVDELISRYYLHIYLLSGLMDSMAEELRLDIWTKNINVTSVYLATVATGMYPPPSHRFRSWYGEVLAKDAATIIIDGTRSHTNLIRSRPHQSGLREKALKCKPYVVRLTADCHQSFRSV